MSMSPAYHRNVKARKAWLTAHPGATWRQATEAVLDRGIFTETTPAVRAPITESSPISITPAQIATLVGHLTEDQQTVPALQDEPPPEVLPPTASELAVMEPQRLRAYAAGVWGSRLDHNGVWAAPMGLSGFLGDGDNAA